MAGRYTKLNPDVIGTIIQHIKAGAYDYVAAQAAGIHPTTFINWMKWGESDALEYAEYAEFRRLIMQTRAEARLIAEGWVFKEKPDTWLLKGPGRERPGEPGWSNETTVNLQDAKHRVQFVFVDDEGSEPDADEDSDDTTPETT